MKTRDHVGPLTEENGEVITDDVRTAKVLNDYFSSVFTLEQLHNIPQPNRMFDGPNDDMLRDVEVTAENVLKVLMKLKPGKAPRVDEIYAVVLREVSGVIAEPLSQIFQKSLAEGVVPLDWRRANVTPIFKKGKRSVSANYRPISLTAQVSKVIETILRDAIMEHLTAHRLISDSQHGFLEASCLTNLLTFLELVTKTVDDGNPVDAVYLDFSKAFNRVPHQRLLTKLRSHGIGESTAAWIEAWL
ncbi:uncharacterized protein LOC117290458 [Asterias rubens]|uniref:uncharacterized protein LOC117290458 n=1 Tax=Asterias rubens TaxID=7604 RepID=UPI00145582D2|nr:uncharacterized protein LOC117290458 [Asterias rubens]